MWTNLDLWCVPQHKCSSVILIFTHPENVLKGKIKVAHIEVNDWSIFVLSVETVSYFKSEDPASWVTSGGWCSDTQVDTGDSDFCSSSTQTLFFWFPVSVTSEPLESENLDTYSRYADIFQTLTSGNDIISNDYTVRVGRKGSAVWRRLSRKMNHLLINILYMSLLLNLYLTNVNMKSQINQLW